MNITPNGTDAKDIAMHFFKLTNQRATSQIIGRAINQAKSILQSGYTKKEIIDVMDYIMNVKRANMYSLGYVSATINDMLREMRQAEQEELLRKQKEEVRVQMVEVLKQSEVTQDGESTERNREKAKRIQSGFQSRFREKFNIDMFEE